MHAVFLLELYSITILCLYNNAYSVGPTCLKACTQSDKESVYRPKYHVSVYNLYDGVKTLHDSDDLKS